MKFPTFNPNESLHQYNFTQYFNPSKMKKIIESEWNVEYDEDWLFENGIRDITDAKTHITKIYRSSKNGRFQPRFLRNDYGRYFYKGSLSIGLLVCPIRHSLCREDYIDFDMINAHYKILEQLCIQKKYQKKITNIFLNIVINEIVLDKIYVSSISRMKNIQPQKIKSKFYSYELCISVHLRNGKKIADFQTK